jgi:hypothetical protein
MPRRSAGRAALFLLALSFLAAPALAGGSRADRSTSPASDLTHELAHLWIAVVQHLPFGNATAADTTATPDTPADQSEADRSASLDPWG